SVATTGLAGQPPIFLLGDTIRLSYAENPGGFLSVGAGLPEWVRVWMFVALAIVAVFALAVFSVHKLPIDLVHLIALTMLIGGGVGNIIDRVIYGAVRDFLNVGVGPIRTGVFNVADLAITFASVLLVLRAWKERVP